MTESTGFPPVPAEPVAPAPEPAPVPEPPAPVPADVPAPYVVVPLVQVDEYESKGYQPGYVMLRPE
jgi:OmpA-OmpF porin, OOP family